VPCARKSAPPIFFRLGIEHVDEEAADGLALHFGVGDAFEFAEENLRRINVHQRDVVVVPEQVDDGLGFVEPQHAVVDEHAGELVADGLMDQHCGDCRVDAAGEAADHPALADLRADLFDRLLAEGAHGPVAGEARKPCGRKLRISLAPSGVCTTSGWNIKPVIFALLVLDDGERRVGRDAGHRKARRHFCDAVAMAHPHLDAFRPCPRWIRTGCSTP
jgi:hypothetical protein